MLGYVLITYDQCPFHIRFGRRACRLFVKNAKYSLQQSKENSCQRSQEMLQEIGSNLQENSSRKSSKRLETGWQHLDQGVVAPRLVVSKAGSVETNPIHMETCETSVSNI